MVKLNYAFKNGNLSLRISEKKERYYKSVKSLLLGNPNIAKHWDESKQRFTNNAVNCAENNKRLEAFKEQFAKVAREHPEYSAKQISDYYDNKRNGISGDNLNANQCDLVEEYLQIVIEREKAKSGCNFETYAKLLSKCRKIMPEFSTLTFSSLNCDKCIQIAKIFAKYNGYKGTSKSFRNLLGKASNDNNVTFSLTQIGDFKFAHYNPKRDQVETKSPDVLNPRQLKRFLSLDIEKLTPTYKDRKTVELYYDFCVFMLHSFFAPCDVIKLKHSDIKKGEIKVKRKKTHQAVSVPISDKMEQIISKYKGYSTDGYIFPIMNDNKAKEYITQDYLFKKFREKLNIWLKAVGRMLKTEFDLYAYVFRHTAITTALDKGLSTSYVASTAGTSIEMIQEHYYNGNNSVNHERIKSMYNNL